MKRLWVVLTLLVMPVFSQIRPGHQLPEGTYHPAREREIDIQDYKADLHFDMDKEEITGAATLTFTSLRTALAEFSLDAADLQIKVMNLPGNNGTPSYEVKDRKLRIRMPRALNPGQAAVLTIEYACRPKTGMYFFPKTATRSAQAWNYGEGGLHYAWLPIYNDTNDRFTAEFSVTVARPYSVLSNGRLIETRDNPDRTRTFRWVQDKPVPNYLLTIDVGEFARIPIGEARAGSNGIPLAAWCSPGMEETAKFAFRDTPRMVEFEADDAIAAAAVRFGADPEVERILICTPDKDMAQLVVDDRIVLRDRRRGITYNRDGVLGIPSAPSGRSAGFCAGL